jgi:hypothetical protein
MDEIMDEIIPLAEVARQMRFKLATIERKDWRERVGLPVVKLGGKVVGVRAHDLARALRREFEPPPSAA